MDQDTLEALAQTVTLIRNSALKSTASEAGKAVWSRISRLFDWEAESPATGDLTAEITQKLEAEPGLAEKVRELLRQRDVRALVSQINAEKVVVAEKIDTVNM